MTAAVKRELAIIPVSASEGGYSTSGLQLMAPRVYGGYYTPANSRPRTGVIVMHPTSNFMDHYLLAPLAEAGYAALGLTSRFLNNEPSLLVEMIVLDLAAGVDFLLGQGIERVVLVGNSGGGALVSLYQSHAEAPGKVRNALGAAMQLGQMSIKPVHGIILAAAHAGRPETLTEFLDPSVTDETDPSSRDPALDMFDPANGPPYEAGWVARYRESQIARNHRISTWARARLAALEGTPFRDQPFLVHRTHADPRFLDLSIDPSDRPVGSLWGDPYQLNYAGVFLARFTTLRSWLSQWSLESSHLAGPQHLAQTSCPVLVVNYTADQAAFASHARAFYDAVRHTARTYVDIKGATHYLIGQPEQMREVVRTVTGWLESNGF